MPTAPATDALAVSPYSIPTKSSTASGSDSSVSTSGATGRARRRIPGAQCVPLTGFGTGMNAGLRRSATTEAAARWLLIGPDPDVAVVHELDLLVDDLAPVLLVPVRGAIEVEILRIDRLLVDQLILLCGLVLDPVVPLGSGAEPAQRFDVDCPCDPGRSAPVVVPADNLAAIVDHGRPAAERGDRHVRLTVQVVGAHIAGDEVHVVVQRARPVLHLEQAVSDVRVWIGAAVHDLGTIHGQAAVVFRIGTLVRHQETQPADLGVGDRVKRVQGAAVQLDPSVPDVVWCH